MVDVDCMVLIFNLQLTRRDLTQLFVDHITLAAAIFCAKQWKRERAVRDSQLMVASWAGGGRCFGAVTSY